MSGQGKGKAHPELITMYGETSPFAEAYRVLRINLLQWRRNGKRRPIWSLGITGVRPRYGSTTVAANLGLIMRETGSRTVVVDGDLYKPSLHQFFQISNEVGLSTVLQGQTEVGRALQDVTGPPPLRVLPAGPKVGNPVALLQPEAVKTLLDRLKELTDFLIIDLPSVTAVAYTPFVASSLDGLLLVVRAGTTSAGMDSLVKHRLRGVHVIGMVLNQLPVERSEVSSYRHYARAKG